MADLKELVASVLSSRVRDGDVLGIGSGSTVERAVERIGERIRKEGLRVAGIPTSHKVGLFAERAGIEVLAPVSARRLAWAFDGADEVDDRFRAIKGQGAAMLNEKIIARRAERLVIIVSEEKIVQRLGSTSPVPLEVISEASGYVRDEVLKLGAKRCELRTYGEKERLVITEHNNLILDAAFDQIDDALDAQLKCITGVVDHGLFMNCITEVLVAKAGKVVSQTLEGGVLVERPV